MTNSNARDQRRRGLVGALGAVGALLVVVAVMGSVFGGLSWADWVNSYTLTNLVIGAGFTVCGVLIGWNRPGNALGWLFLACGLGHLLTATTIGPLAYAEAHAWPDGLTQGISTLFGASWQLGIVGLFPLTLLLFPDGHYPSPRWRPLGWVVVASTILQLVTGMLSGGNPVGTVPAPSLSVGFTIPAWLGTALGIVNLASLILVIASLFVRYRRGTEKVRNQLLWLILAVIVLLVLNSQRWFMGDGPILFLLSFVLVPSAITVAVLRYQLLDIRLVVSRTVLYLLVSLVAIAVYAGLVAGVSLLLPAAADRGVAIASALVVAFGFNPLRVRLQRLIDRAFYGSRGDPVGTAIQLGGRLESGDDLGGLVERTRAALRLPQLALIHHGRPVADAGHPLPDGNQSSIPLSFRGMLVGELVVGLRRGDSTLHQADREILELLATPLAIALHSTDLAEQVQASRAAIVGAREQERVHLHRDLHDGLGPLLTAAAFRADAVHNVLRTDLERADLLLSQVRTEIRQALGDVRGVVYGLRPLELEELGLVGAVRERVTAAQRGGAQPLVIDLDAPDELPELSPAVEVAAYRIAVEAVTNVARHSPASNCVVRVRAGDQLTIEVTDDGPAGPDPWTAGVGIRSILDRAEELGGHASAAPTTTGGRVFAALPLTSGADAHPVR